MKVQPTTSPWRTWRGSLLALCILTAALAPVFIGLSSGRAGALTSQATTPCVTDAYTHTTVEPCSSTTTTPTSSTTTGATIVLTIEYSHGVLTWQACGYPPAADGTAVYLYLNGQLQTEPGGTGTVQSNGCTDPSLRLCPSTATAFTAVAVDPGYGGTSSNSRTFEASPSDCSALAAGSGGTLSSGVVAAGSSISLAPSTAASGGGSLPFTGANILRLIAIAIIVIAAGLAIVQISKKLRQHRG
jgi:hypothetical protein